MTSSSVEKRIRAARGPNVSSPLRRQSVDTSASTVGWNIRPSPRLPPMRIFAPLLVASLMCCLQLGVRGWERTSSTFLTCRSWMRGPWVLCFRIKKACKKHNSHALVEARTDREAFHLLN